MPRRRLLLIAAEAEHLERKEQRAYYAYAITLEIIAVAGFYELIRSLFVV